MSNKPIIGISGCLMGHQVRFDGGHKRDRFITDTLSEHMEIKTVCPEMGMGLGSPRPTIRLQDINSETRLVVSKDTKVDLTDKMHAYSESVLGGMSNLDGFIFKKGSPSCGAWRVPVVVHKDGHRRHDGTGLFAKAFMQRFPWIPVEEEGRLNDTNLRENFLERVYTLRRWHDIQDPDNNLTGFINFHARHKLMLMARRQTDYRKLGRFVANTTQQSLKERRQIYLAHFMQAMSQPADKKNHINVLMHVMGYFKRSITASDKQELLYYFDAYRKNHIQLIALITLFKHHLRNHPDSYLEQQHYLTPCPPHFALRATV